MWGAIKQVLPGTKKSTVSSIFENGKWHTEIFSVSRNMNQYFVSVGRVLAKPFQNVSTVFTSSTLPIEFHLDNVNMNFVRNALKSFKRNKAVGLDKLIKCSFVEGRFWRHRPILAGLINKSFTDGVFPGVWKCAKVTALFKDGDKSLKDNYRPISILPTISKIRSAHIQLSSFLEETILLSQSQFGFRLKRSTSTTLTAFADQVLESMDKGCVTGTMFVDLRKASDTVDHLLFINKLKSLGVAGKSLEWFHS